MTGERRRRAAAVLARDQDNVVVRKRNARVGGFDARIVPLPDAAGEHVEIDIARKPEFARHARNIVREHDHAGGHRNHDGPARFRGVTVVQDFIAAGEIDRVGKKRLIPSPLPTTS